LPLALLLHTLVVISGSLIPLKLAQSWTEVQNALQASMTLHIHEPIYITLTERLLAFLPMGMLACLVMSQMKRSRVLTAATGLTLLVALTIEIAQAFVGRHARLTDFLLAAVFAAVGCTIGQAIIGSRARALGALRAGASHRVAAFWYLVLVLILCNASILAILTVAYSGLHIAGWNCGYPLVIGNEATHDRPWLGWIRGLAIYDKVPTESEIARLTSVPMTAANSAVRRRAGALLIYAFDTINESRVSNLGLATPTDDLDGIVSGSAGHAPNDGSIEISDSVEVHTRNVPADLCRQIMTTESFAIEAEIATADASQTGPARIVSMSLDTFQRNFTLGQELGALVFRVRTPRNGPNGLSLPAHTNNRALIDGWKHIWATHGNGSAEIFVDGSPQLASPDGHRLIIVDPNGPPVPVSEIVAVICFAAGTVGAALLIGRGRLRSWLTGYALAGVLPLLYALVLSVWHSYQIDLILVAAVIIAPGLGMVVGSILAKRLNHRQASD
jgi:hypothetical protein